MSLSLKAPGRVGKIGYLNCLPFYHRLFESHQKATRFEIYESYPSKINLAMRKGKVDIAPISSLEYLNHQDLYSVLPGLAIGARDFSGSVLLLSKERIEHLDGESICLSRQSLSSATLLRILLRYKYKFTNHFIPSAESPAVMLQKAKAALVIGDDALLFDHEEFLYKYDLSELWWSWTGKPFCFALWAVRKDYAAKCPYEVRQFAQDVRRNARRNLTDIEALIRETMDIGFLDSRFGKLYGYFFNLLYFMDDSLQEGLKLFYRLAHRLGISPRPREICFFD